MVGALVMGVVTMALCTAGVDLFSAGLERGRRVGAVAGPARRAGGAILTGVGVAMAAGVLGPPASGQARSDRHERCG